MVLEAVDVRKDHVVVTLLDEAHGNPSNRRLDRYAAIHERQSRAADARHGGGAIRLEDIRDDAHGVREGLLGGYYGDQGTLGQGAVSDLAPPRRPDPAGLAGGVGWEVVMVHVALAGLRLYGVKPLGEPQIREC